MRWIRGLVGGIAIAVIAFVAERTVESALGLPGGFRLNPAESASSLHPGIADASWLAIGCAGIGFLAGFWYGLTRPKTG